VDFVDTFVEERRLALIGFVTERGGGRGGKARGGISHILVFLTKKNERRGEARSVAGAAAEGSGTRTHTRYCIGERKRKGRFLIHTTLLPVWKEKKTPPPPPPPKWRGDPPPPQKRVDSG